MADRFNKTVWRGTVSMLDAAHSMHTGEVEIVVDEDALRALARRALRNKNGKAKVGPFIARKLSEAKTQ